MLGCCRADGFPLVLCDWHAHEPSLMADVRNKPQSDERKQQTVKPNKTDIRVQSTVSGNVHQMGIDHTAIRHFMNMLTDIAKEPKIYLLQELACNAIDSHVEAGVSRPIDVWLPSGLNPVLRVCDYGLGMDEGDIDRTYRFYGASSKRQSNDQIGMLGIGAKSPLAYTSQFTVKCTKAGRLIVVSVSRDEDGGGSMTVVEDTDTDEPNGVEVIVPTKRGDTFAEQAAQLFQYWGKGEVLVNGKEPERVQGLELSPSLMLVERERDSYRRDDSQNSVVVMGRVAYPIPSSENVWPDDKYRVNHRLVARVAIGDVDFTPARDALQMNARTKARLQQIRQEIRQAATAACQRDVDHASSPGEALKLAVKWTEALYETATPQPTYKGNVLPTEFKPPTRIKLADGTYVTGEDTRWIVSSRKSWKQSETSRYNILTQPQMARSLIVENYTIKFIANHKKKLVKYCEDKGYDIKDVEHFILYPGKVDRTWLDDWQVVDWADDIRGIQLVTETGERLGGTRGAIKSISGSYEVHSPTQTGGETAADDIDTENNIYYLTTEMFEKSVWSTAARLLRNFDKKCSVVRLQMNRVDKFRRDFPAAKDGLKELARLAVEKRDALPEVVKRAYAVKSDRQQSNILSVLDFKNIEDPELKELAELAQKPIDEYIKPILDVDRLFASTGHWSKLPWWKPGARADVIPAPSVNCDVIQKYKLLGVARWNASLLDKEHTVIYINAVYAKECERRQPLKAVV